MKWKVLKTERDYTKATNRLMQIFHAAPGTTEGDEMELLMVLVKDYDDKHHIIPHPATIEVLSGRREITLKMAQRLKDYFNLPAEVFLHSA